MVRFLDIKHGKNILFYSSSHELGHRRGGTPVLEGGGGGMRPPLLSVVPVSRSAACSQAMF
jgi:hypothetical protein